MAEGEPGAWLPLADASRRLGLTVDALRHRVRKGELDSRRGNDGRVLVLVGGEPPASARIADAGAELALLRDELADVANRASRAEGELAGLREALAEARGALAAERAGRERLETQLAEARKPALVRTLAGLVEAFKRR